MAMLAQMAMYAAHQPDEQSLCQIAYFGLFRCHHLTAATATASAAALEPPVDLTPILSWVSCLGCLGQRLPVIGASSLYIQAAGACEHY